MANSVPWDQSPEFLAATEREIPPGGLTSYVNPRPVGNSPSDVTSFIYGLAKWSDRDFLPLFYQWEPTAEWMAFKVKALPPQKVDANGTPLFEPFPEAGKQPEELLDFPGLPDQIGTQETWEFLEYVRRVDPRIRWIDVLMRMQLDGRRSQTALNTEASRGRDVYNMSSWHIKRKSVRPAIQPMPGNIYDRLSPAQRAANTTRGITPGLINPLQGAASKRIDLPRQSILRKPKKPKRGPPKELSWSQDSNGESESNRHGGFRGSNELRNSPKNRAGDHQDVDGEHEVNQRNGFRKLNNLTNVSHKRTRNHRDIDDTGVRNCAKRARNRHDIYYTNESNQNDSFEDFNSLGNFSGNEQRVHQDAYYPSKNQVLMGFGPQSSTSESGTASFDGMISNYVESNAHNARFKANFSYEDDYFPFLSRHESRYPSEDQASDNAGLHPFTDELGASSAERDLPEVEIIDHDMYDYYGYEIPRLL